MKQFVSLVFLVFFSLTAAAAPGSIAGSRAQPVEKSPAQLAEQNYKSGSKALAKAHKYESKFKSEKNDKSRAKLQKKMDKAFAAAAKKFAVAVKHDSSLFQAHSDLGYTHRRLGNYDKALASYNKSLELNPKYAPAIEYRAETYLALGRLDDAKDAYMHLFESERPLADKLLNAMLEWTKEPSQHPNSISDESLSEFVSWVNQRMAIAKQTASLTATPRSW